MKLTITQTYITDRSKDGKLFVNKDGNPYKKIAIKTREYGEEWLSGFVGKWNEWWQNGATIDADIEEVTQNGKKYLNLKRPDPVKELMDRVSRIEADIKSIKKALNYEERI